MLTQLLVDLYRVFPILVFKPRAILTLDSFWDCFKRHILSLKAFFKTGLLLGAALSSLLSRFPWGDPSTKQKRTRTRRHRRNQA
jgi:hypothetical protein